ncbi:hypothetical protein ASC77_07255 [Nocardioides sp. Root1257]|uniref:hypothetical protein n=1 Tax=unclassified Nocardioides TaxID=2615069 RepID=UPI0006F6EF7B|nr:MULTISPECIES: hypothetical protein [unclassified Nocardioides]KQW48540.1 hypothetical protein ASC77_07255 [Nocardioides sp. Root1257]KRC47716.1 hypothetical protein ASE24_07260 [Nocardioides sp. Root224]
MKKLISGLIAAFLLSAGFVAVSAETASAACQKTQYTPCPVTVTKAAGAKTVKKGKKPKAIVSIKSAGNVKPKGKVTIIITGPGVRSAKTITYNGKSVSYVGPALKKKGTYKVTISFKGTNTRDSKTSYTIKVK